jgi:two-component system, cell cycle response regulator DivK
MTGTPILVVDGRPVNLKLTRLLLTREGYLVRTAECAEDALQMLSSYRPELILTDLQLPGMNGLNMTQQVKENPRTSAIKVVALTAGAAKEDRDRALRAGCEDFICTPVDTPTLTAKLRELLARPPLGQAARLEAPPDNQPASSASGPEIESVRRRFLNQGAERSRQLLDSPDSAFDSLLASLQLHAWIGTAALLGHREISSLSRQAEEFLREEPVKMSRLRDVLTRLFLAFAELRDTMAAPLPEFVVQAMAGKRVALIGFRTERADAMCAVLERVKARPRLFDGADDPDSEAIRDCDLVVFHVRPETLGSSWLRPGVPVPAVPKLVFTGDQGDLIALAPDVRSQVVDVLVDGGEPEEALMRLAFAVSRTGFAVSDRYPAAPTVADAPVRPRRAVDRPTVVLADDDRIVLALMGPMLENYGMSCRSADNGVDALSLLRSEQPDVAILDANMPAMDGYQVLAAVRAEKIPSRVVFLTAYQEEKHVLRAFELGVDDYLTKPFNPFELVARLKRLM